MNVQELKKKTLNKILENNLIVEEVEKIEKKLEKAAIEGKTEQEVFLSKEICESFDTVWSVITALKLKGFHVVQYGDSFSSLMVSWEY